MEASYKRSDIVKAIKQTFANPAALKSAFQDTTLPPDILNWLSRLALLQGVPFNYLVPDERMLPPESIRFFYLDSNWIGALLDGAFSIGRNLTDDEHTAPSMIFDKALHKDVLQQVQDAGTDVRAKLFGLQGKPPVMNTITGFVLRSSLVLEYPSMGVNVYAYGHTPSDPNPQMLTILRLDQLGPKSDTMICLVSGDAYRVDIHEAPQALHYGIDCFNNGCQVKTKPAMAVKNLNTFGVNSTTSGGATTNTITMSPNAIPVDISSAFRSTERVIELSKLAGIILQTNATAPLPPGTKAPTDIDSAAMGFEMTQGVGMVSFFKKS